MERKEGHGVVGFWALGSNVCTLLERQGEHQHVHTDTTKTHYIDCCRGSNVLYMQHAFFRVQQNNVTVGVLKLLNQRVFPLPQVTTGAEVE